MTHWLSAATAVCCLGIALRLLTYRPTPWTRYRRSVAWAAWALIVITGGHGLQLLLLGVHAPANAWQLGLLLILLLGLCRARGNLARLFGP